MTSELWTQKGATLSDKNARKEYGLTNEHILQAIRDGRLQYREGSMHGNPWFRLLRHEVEELAVEVFGEDYLEKQKQRSELAQVSKEIRSLNRKKKELEARQTELKSLLADDV